MPGVDRGIRSWALLRLGEASTWRSTAHLVIAAVAGFPIAIALGIEVVTVGTLMGTPLVAVDKPVRVGDWTMSTPLATWPLVLAGIVSLAVFLYVNMLVGYIMGSVTESLLSAREPELTRKVSALDQSRAVILDAFDAERRRIEQDLHDGVQQTLVSSALTLGLIKRHPEAEPLLPLIDRAIAQNRAGLQALRQTLLGISPPVLADHGLVAALRSLVDGSSLEATLVLDDLEYAEVRCDPRVEKAAYFIVSEALTNVTKHAGRLEVTVTVRGDAQTLTVLVADRGSGGADLTAGNGLAGLTERASALGGRLTITSCPSGTVIAANLPRGTKSSVKKLSDLR
jgi:signal transduction histidine kinase